MKQVAVCLMAALTAPAWAAAPGRVTMPLDGEWEIAESTEAGAIPTSFSRRVPVPGLVNLARPPFPAVDQFDSREIIDNRIRKKTLPESARITSAGVSSQPRNYFWYRRTFRAAARKQTATLRIGKAQFGTAVWLNGKLAGEHAGCFTAGYFDLSRDIDWNGDNHLLVRIGAHPAAMPAATPAGTDFEKLKWTPGIYDSVELMLADNPVIESVQAAPRISAGEVLIETRIRNRSNAPVTFALTHRVREWKGGIAAGSPVQRRLTLTPGEVQTILDRVPLRDAHLWTPEDPFLYLAETSTGGDSVATRFGMREFRFDTATRRAYLNGKVYFLRGSNITLHRFFEDPKAGSLVWSEPWVRKLLIEIPKKMHWNSFRFCIGPVPRKWLDIADEAGLLIQYEYPIWTGRNAWHQEWGENDLIRELSEWVQDNWNHPSVAIWDSSNETIAGVLGSKVIPAARALDLSNRPWENGYNLPAGPDDPYEDHPYLFSGIASKPPTFRLTDLETMEFFRRPNAAHPTAHAAILNEYGWLWLNRDGSPTLLTKDVWDAVLGPQATNQQRLQQWAYLLGGLTEFWRSRRSHAAVLHFVYLTCSFPGVYTSDHFRDVEKLELDPDFAEYVSEAFKPLGVYLNFWQASVKAGEPRTFPVSVVNDAGAPSRGTLAVRFMKGGVVVCSREEPYQVPALGQHTFLVEVTAPSETGDYLVVAEARSAAGSTVSRRKVRLQ